MGGRSLPITTNRWNSSFLSGALWRLMQIRLSYLVAILCTLLVSILFILHFCVSQILARENQLSYKKNLSLKLLNTDHESDAGIAEMQRVRHSVSQELVALEASRNGLYDQVASYSEKVDQLKTNFSRLELEYQRLKTSVEQIRRMESELAENRTPQLAAPRRLEPPADVWPQLASPSHASLRRRCTLDGCWDFSHCPLTVSLAWQLYPLSEDAESCQSPAAAARLHAALSTVRGAVPGGGVCARVAVVCASTQQQATRLLTALPQWAGDGRNHLLLAADARSAAALRAADTGRALIVDADAPLDGHRPGFDLLLPVAWTPTDTLSALPQLVPVRRAVLLTFQAAADADPLLVRLQAVFQSQTLDQVHVELDCSADPDEESEGAAPDGQRDWSLCGSTAQRAVLLSAANFALLPAPRHGAPSSSMFQRRLTEALAAGAVPVLLGQTGLLPLSPAVDWNRATLSVAASRLPELHYLLRSVSDTDILTLRRSGRQIWERYLSSPERMVRALLTSLSDRLGMPPAPVSPTRSVSAFSAGDVQLTGIVELDPSDESSDEYLGPIEPPSASPQFQRNYTAARLDAYTRWNVFYEPHRLYPSLPYDGRLSSDARFNGSARGFRPVNGGEGGSGREFSAALGGNEPYEQFTVLLLTYRREQVLMAAVARLRGLPYLNRVLVVWNDAEQPPTASLRWPDIGVPVHVVRPGSNSLNNRFLPFDLIETDAVLSLDDDVHLRHDEIVFGFRVWREQRHRLVGFPGRYHAWDPRHTGWHYNSNHSCELSMVLTGAAFFHRYYSYMYSRWMPQVIRDKVDEYMNCEDIAMNFLISHLTREPPLKLTTRWTFRCPECPVLLSEDETHFLERHRCINYFASVFGYMPLLYTQFRLDSVLFKTRLPPEQQKCFRYV